MKCMGRADKDLQIYQILCHKNLDPQMNFSFVIIVIIFSYCFWFWAFCSIPAILERYCHFYKY